jgi:hypothetical protein
MLGRGGAQKISDEPLKPPLFFLVLFYRKAAAPDARSGPAD